MGKLNIHEIIEQVEDDSIRNASQEDLREMLKVLDESDPGKAGPDSILQNDLFRGATKTAAQQVEECRK